VSEPINFFLNSDNLKPRSEVRIEKLDAQPLPDGRRVKVQLDVTPFREKPSFEIAILDAAGARVGGTTVIEAMTFRLELTLHLRGVAQPEGDYTLHVALYYEDPAEPQDHAQTTITIPAPAE
jgi:hypothetical protein